MRDKEKVRQKVMSEARREEIVRMRQMFGGVELLKGKTREKTGQPRSALIRPLGNISQAFKTRRALVVEKLSLVQLQTPAKRK